MSFFLLSFGRQFSGGSRSNFFYLDSRLLVSCGLLTFAETNSCDAESND